jgi:hypothetical protein
LPSAQSKFLAAQLNAQILALLLDDGDGALTAADTTLASASVIGAQASFPLALTLTTPQTFFVAADFSALPANETFGVALRDVAAGGTVSVAATNLTLSYIAQAPAPTVDGAFGDWAGVALTPDPIGDVANRSGVSALVNANIDLAAVASDLAGNASFYLRVDGTILGGVDVPNLRARTPVAVEVDSDLDTVPDNLEFTLGNPDLRYDFDNDNVTDARTNNDVDGDNATDYPSGPDLWLNTTVPAWYPAPYAGRAVSRYIGPIAPRILEGVDSAIVYVDG